MASSEHPETSPAANEMPAPTSIQTTSSVPASAEPSSITLPPLAPPVMDESRFPRLRGRLDAALLAVVLVFAFVAASFPAANPDLFRQLATGRLLLHGDYHFGVDPFVHSADDTYWVNHSWLFALLMYGLYHLPPIGGAAVVIFKALVVVTLAEILLRISRRRGQSLWIPAACVTFAILVVSPRLYLQSTVLSFLFLGMTLWLLSAVGRDGKRLWWLLPPLFALWVNCDAWFVLGPLTVALYLAGELLQQRISFSREPKESASDALSFGSRLNDQAGEPRTLGVVLAIGVAACLLNPHHLHALTLPHELGFAAAGEVLENDPQFYTFYLSPLNSEYYHPGLGWSVAGVAYWPLLLLSLASFVLVAGRPPWPRLLLWLGFALLSLYNVRAIPFFAIVASPIMAWNWLDYTTRRFSARPVLTIAGRRWSLGGRIVTLLIGLALLIAAAPGWLANQPRSRKLGWSVRVDPSLKSMAETIQAWRQAGKLPDDPHWLNLYYEIADYLAWFAPGERVFVDPSLPYFRAAADDYLAVRGGLQHLMHPSTGVESELIDENSAWRKVLRKRHVHYWIFDHVAFRQGEPIVDRVLFAPQMAKEWVLCYLNGRFAIFAWRDPQQPGPDPSAKLKLDLHQLAFGNEALPAPPRGTQPSTPGSWWETYWQAWWQPAPPPSSDRESAGLYDAYYQIVERSQAISQGLQACQAALAARAVANSLPHGPVPNSLLALSWSCTYHDLFPSGAIRPARPPRHAEEPALAVLNRLVSNQFVEMPSLYLAVRAARRALAVNPNDGLSYFRLGQAYQRLRGLPQEQRLQALGSPLADIRRIQMVAAYQNALRFPLDEEKAALAHEALFQVYVQLRYLDAEVHHLREALDKWTALGRATGLSSAEYNQKLAKMSAHLANRENELQRQRDTYELRTASKSGLEKVTVALQERLPETALEVLEQSADTEVSTQKEVAAVKLASAVALELGQIDRARDLLPDPQDDAIKPDEMEAYLRLAAARGDYEKADRFLEHEIQHYGQPQPGQPPTLDNADKVGLLVGRVLLGQGQRLMGTPFMPVWPNNPDYLLQRPRLVENASDFWLRRWRLGAIANGLRLSLPLAELHMMQGWLALEAGHAAEAWRHLRIVRDTSVPLERWVPEVNKLDALLRPEEIQGFRQLGVRHAVLHDLSRYYLSWPVK